MTRRALPIWQRHSHNNAHLLKALLVVVRLVLGLLNDQLFERFAIIVRRPLLVFRLVFCVILDQFFERLAMFRIVLRLVVVRLVVVLLRGQLFERLAFV